MPLHSAHTTVTHMYTDYIHTDMYYMNTLTPTFQVQQLLLKNSVQTSHRCSSQVLCSTAFYTLSLNINSKQCEQLTCMHLWI